MVGFAFHLSSALVLAEGKETSEFKFITGNDASCADDPAYRYFRYNVLDLLTVRRGYNLMSLQEGRTRVSDSCPSLEVMSLSVSEYKASKKFVSEVVSVSTLLCI